MSASLKRTFLLWLHVSNLFGQSTLLCSQNQNYSNTLKASALEFSHFTLSTGYQSPLIDLSFEVQTGESIGIVGPSGSGKSTLLKVMSQSIWDDSNHQNSVRLEGNCSILGFPVTPKKPTLPTLEILRSKTAFVGQNSTWLPVSIAENFALIQMLSGSENPEPFENILESLPLSQRNRAQIFALAELMPTQIERPLLQQLAIIRALLRKPAFLLFDEPFLGMDPVLLRQTENLILNLAEKSTLIWATNDLHQASRVTDHILFMLHGRAIEYTSTPQFFTHPKSREAESFIAGRDDEF